MSHDLLDEARAKSEEIKTPADAIEAWRMISACCMIPAWLMQQDDRHGDDDG